MDEENLTKYKDDFLNSVAEKLAKEHNNGCGEMFELIYSNFKNKNCNFEKFLEDLRKRLNENL